jgi:hypothetical protein
MPTSVLAVHTAAAEALARLRFYFPQVAEMREFRYFPSSSKAGGEFSSAVKEADPALARLVQFIDAQALLIAGIIREFQSLDRDNTRAIMKAYHDAHQAASQITLPLLPNPEPPSQPVLPSQPVSPWQPLASFIPVMLPGPFAVFVVRVCFVKFQPHLQQKHPNPLWCPTTKMEIGSACVFQESPSKSRPTYGSE